ncbi:hypothetical protein MED297_06004 [Reinekea sp. MED297]|uniref:Uncharacterized protein n=2 Tax=Reinekea TaxID=230494 RepID=A4BDD5_9GAMM|nr:hypothetical protein MED297_06004 [Reinekea sp. MED297] [Reinekea blandensis MED297]
MFGYSNKYSINVRFDKKRKPPSLCTHKSNLSRPTARIRYTPQPQVADMFRFLKSDPTRALQKTYEKLTTEAFQAQRNGDIRKYSVLTAEAESVKVKIDELKQTQD